ncbi:MAG: recombinase family protein [Acidobacteriia bacterium]|nr:recombinase family protein [Terriglobia bacterium]
MSAKRNGNGSNGNGTGPVVCAIYTRKSTDEGLERDFNSLDAQREAAEAYVRSQEGNGWVLSAARFDDGGYSGGTLERPALQRLLGEVRARRVQRIVVYKIDRLSRSLLDFARLAEVFEEHGTGIVSVTQQLDTSTSMGRLTLNMLLSFAQFEREMVSDRTRDKAHAARRRGKFIGGQLPLGYDRTPEGGRLVVNPDEAGRVCDIFKLFLENPSIIGNVEELRRRGWTLKRWTTREDRVYGGRAFDKHSLGRLLRNPVYIGEVHFDGGVYPAEHEAIVDRETWNRAQELLREAKPQTRATSSPALLAGLLRCVPCDSAMTPSFSQKGSTRYRYYACVKAQRQGWKSCLSKSLPAREIEGAVVDRLRAIGRDPGLIEATLEQARKVRTTRRRELEDQIRQVRDEIDEAHSDRRKQIVRFAAGFRRGDEPPVDVPELEGRLAGLAQELESLRRLRIDAADLRKALGQFTPVWDHLTALEQQRVVKLLVDRIDYDGRTGKVAITFSALGVRTLAAEKAPTEAAR